MLEAMIESSVAIKTSKPFPVRLWNGQDLGGQFEDRRVSSEFVFIAFHLPSLILDIFRLALNEVQQDIPCFIPVDLWISSLIRLVRLVS
jgi:hypothetical protein